MGIEWVWTHKGSVAVPAALEPEEAISRLADAIRHKQHIQNVRAERDRLHFSQSIFAIRPNWLALVPYSSGELWVDGAGPAAVVRYRLRLQATLIFCLAAACFFATMGASESAGAALRFGSTAFAWLYGGNYILAAIRAPSFFQNVLTENSAAADDLTLAGKIGCLLILGFLIGGLVFLSWPAVDG